MLCGSPGWTPQIRSASSLPGTGAVRGRCRAVRVRVQSASCWCGAVSSCWLARLPEATFLVVSDPVLPNRTMQASSVTPVPHPCPALRAPTPHTSFVFPPSVCKATAPRLPATPPMYTPAAALPATLKCWQLPEPPKQPLLWTLAAVAAAASKPSCSSSRRQHRWRRQRQRMEEARWKSRGQTRRHWAKCWWMVW